MAKTLPTVSIIMAAFNAEQYIGAAIQSCLSQTYQAWELIVVDDASTDTTKNVILSFKDVRIKYVKNHHRLGQAETRNKALKLSKGKLIAILDADDSSDPTRLEKQIQIFEKYPFTALVGSWARVIDNHGQKIATWKFPTQPKQILAQMYLQFTIVHSSAMFRSSIIKQEKMYYNPGMILAEDYDLLFKLSHFGEIRIIPKFLVAYRLHDQNASKAKDEGVASSLEKILGRELKLIQLDFSHQQLSNLVCFLHPNLCGDYELGQALQLLLQINQKLRHKLQLNQTQLAGWDLYVLKTMVYHFLMKVGLK